MTEPSIFTSKILACRQSIMEKKLKAMQRKAQKMGLAPITYMITPIDEKAYLYEDPEGYRYSCHITPSEMKRTLPSHEFTGYVLDQMQVTVSGTAPVFDGWKFVAKLTPTADRSSNLLMVLPRYSNPDLKRYIPQVGVCEHCQQNRYRKETYVVENTKESLLRAVGRNCLSSFVGGASPEKIIAQAEMIFSIPETIDDHLDSDYYKGSGFQAVKSINTRRLLAVGNAMIREYGWVSRAMAQDQMKMSTSDMCWKYFSDFRFPENEAWNPTEDDYKIADETIAWMGQQQETGEYFTNLRTMAAQEYTAHSACGLVVSAIQTLQRKRADSATVPLKDEFYGATGNKSEVVVTLLRLHIVEGWHGTSCIHTFQTEDGFALTWFASGSGSWFNEEDKGKKFRIGFRIKSHNLFRGAKQTLISHVKQLEMAPPVSA